MEADRAPASAGRVAAGSDACLPRRLVAAPAALTMSADGGAGAGTADAVRVVDRVPVDIGFLRAEQVLTRMLSRRSSHVPDADVTTFEGRNVPGGGTGRPC